MNSRFAGVVAIFPAVGNACVAEDESDQAGEARLAANIIRQNNYAALAGFDADQRIGGLAIVTTLVKAATLGAIENDDSQAGIYILALLIHWQVCTERGELMGGGEV